MVLSLLGVDSGGAGSVKAVTVKWGDYETVMAKQEKQGETDLCSGNIFECHFITMTSLIASVTCCGKQSWCFFISLLFIVSLKIKFPPSASRIMNKLSNPRNSIFFREFGTQQPFGMGETVQILVILVGFGVNSIFQSQFDQNFPIGKARNINSQYLDLLNIILAYSSSLPQLSLLSQHLWTVLSL